MDSDPQQRGLMKKKNSTASSHGDAPIRTGRTRTKESTVEERDETPQGAASTEKVSRSKKKSTDTASVLSKGSKIVSDMLCSVAFVTASNMHENACSLSLATMKRLGLKNSQTVILEITDNNGVTTGTKFVASAFALQDLELKEVGIGEKWSVLANICKTSGGAEDADGDGVGDDDDRMSLISSAMPSVSLASARQNSSTTSTAPSDSVVQKKIVRNASFKKIIVRNASCCGLGAPLANVDAVELVPVLASHGNNNNNNGGSDPKAAINHFVRSISHPMMHSYISKQLVGRPFLSNTDNIISISIHGKEEIFVLRLPNAMIPTQQQQQQQQQQQGKTNAMLVDTDTATTMTPTLSTVGCIFKITLSTKLLIKSPQLQHRQQQQQHEDGDNDDSNNLVGTDDDNDNNNNNDVAFEDVGGLSQQIQAIRELVEIPLSRPEIFTKFGLSVPSGILIHGPGGTGKTLLARAICSYARKAPSIRANIFEITPAELSSREYGRNEAKLREIFDRAVAMAPSIIFMDDIDVICPRRDDLIDESSKRIVSELLSLMDLSSSNTTTDYKRVVIIGATSKPNSLDSAARRPGRFDREIELAIPDRLGRQEILTCLLRRRQSSSASLSDAEVENIASRTHGFVGADLQALCNEAGIAAVKRFKQQQQMGTPTAVATTGAAAAAATAAAAGGGGVTVSFADFEEALKLVRPSAMREVMVEIPKVRWEDIGGQEDVKQKLKETVEWQLKHGDAFTRMGIRPPKGVLLYGPPGCSKTLMAKALATEAGLNFIAIRGPELFSKWVGESERAVREVFRKARAASPSIIFFDEIDGLAVERGGGQGGSGGGSSVGDRVLSQMLSELDGINPLEGVSIIAATNRPDIIDKALLRPGRIDRVLYVSPPDCASRVQIFNINLKRMAHDLNAADVEQLAQQTDGYSGAELAAVCREAAYSALQEDIHAQRVSLKHFTNALQVVRPRLTKQMLDFYKNFQESARFR